MYQPKLYLRFDKPIQNDKIGIEQLNKILRLIEIVYPEVSWWDGTSPSGWNPFTGENDDIPDIVKSLTIGYWPDGPNKLTYGIWDTNDYNYSNAIDGWAWFNNFNFDADETSAMFEPLTESIKRDWTVDDLKTLHDNNILLYEVGYDGEPITHDDVIGDGVGDILYIDKWTDGNTYTICYKIKVDGYENGVQECLATSESKIVKWLNNGSLQPVYNFMDVDNEDMFEPLNESEGLKYGIPKIGDKLIYTGKNFENLKSNFTIGKTYTVVNVLDNSILILDNKSRPWDFTTYKLDGLSWEDFFEPLPNVNIDDMFEPLTESESNQTSQFRIGDYVIVNGYYNGDIGSSNNKIVYFDDDFAQIIDTYMGNDGLWYLLEFETKRIDFPKSTPRNQIYLMNDDFDGDSFKMEITIEYPEELDLDTIFGYN